MYVWRRVFKTCLGQTETRVFEIISERMKAAGVIRSAVQCRVKIKSLKTELWITTSDLEEVGLHILLGILNISQNTLLIRPRRGQDFLKISRPAIMKVMHFPEREIGIVCHAYVFNPVTLHPLVLWSGRNPHCALRR